MVNLYVRMNRYYSILIPAKADQSAPADVMGYSNVQLLYSYSEAILSDVLVRYMTCKMRRISRQPYSAFDMGDFRVLATA